ncbi:MAG: DUF2845 domain-containing protein [Gammaproteobacteria bacterium]|nr:MAG: DUF2845 domain-containing protein [Gammaproteobacteria bacterium]
MKLIVGLALPLFLVLSISVKAESLHCKNDIVDIGDTKIDVLRMCGEPSFKDTFCEKVPYRIKQNDGNYSLTERCQNIEMWTYNPGKGQFWTNLYFEEGKLREMKYGDRVE